MSTTLPSLAAIFVGLLWLIVSRKLPTWSFAVILVQVIASGFISGVISAYDSHTGNLIKIFIPVALLSIFALVLFLAEAITLGLMLFFGKRRQQPICWWQGYLIITVGVIASVAFFLYWRNIELQLPRTPLD